MLSRQQYDAPEQFKHHEKEDAKVAIVAAFGEQFTLRHVRILKHLLQHGEMKRTSVDEVAVCVNGPQEIRRLRIKGFELPCERVPHVTWDGRDIKRGIYHLTDADAEKAEIVLQKFHELNHAIKSTLAQQEGNV